MAGAIPGLYNCKTIPMSNYHTPSMTERLCKLQQTDGQGKHPRYTSIRAGHSAAF